MVTLSKIVVSVVLAIIILMAGLVFVDETQHCVFDQDTERGYCSPSEGGRFADDAYTESEIKFSAVVIAPYLLALLAGALTYLYLSADSTSENTTDIQET